MPNFTVDEAFPISRINLDDRRFMSRLNMARWDGQVQTLMDDIRQHGQLAPVGLARFKGEDAHVVIYGFTRTEAMRRLGRSTVRANLYEDLDEKEARVLNAGDNASHQQLTLWERARQIQKLREAGIPIVSETGDPSITQIFNMSRRNVFNWLNVVEYRCPALHQAIGDDQIGLQHALLFIQYPIEVTERLLAPCIQGEWSSATLKLRLQSAMLHPDEACASESFDDDRALLHSPGALAREETSANATLDGAEAREGMKHQLEKAGRWLLATAPEDILALHQEEQLKLTQGLRMVLEVVASLRRSM
jgi:ParB-like nuclease domain